MFAYCGNNPVARKDEGGEFWEAIAIGFIVGIVGQYIGDVIQNIQNGNTGIEIFTPTSSLTDYLASGVGGAIAAFPGLTLVVTMAAGAAGNIMSDFLKGDINSLEDFGKSAVRGGIANGIGYGVAKAMAALKVNQIAKMPRTSRKAYLRDNLYCSPQAYVNTNLAHFNNSSLTNNIKIIESQLALFKSGIYSTVTSTFALLF